MQARKEEILAEAIRAKAYVYRGDSESFIDILDDKEPEQLAELLEQHGESELLYALRRAKNAGVPEGDAIKYVIRVLKNRAKEKVEMEPGTFAVKADKWTWAQIPNELIKDKDLSDRAVRVWCLLRTYAKSDGTEAFPNQTTIAEQLDISERTVIRMIEELRSAGWLDKDKRPCPGAGARHYNVYTLHMEKH